jgi:hypothetical protein
MIKEIEPNAKEYLNSLAKNGIIERVTWGWYWVPDEYMDFFDFLKKDKNFKVLSGQSAASFWNHDFIHRDIYSIKVVDKSFEKALKIFAKNRDWEVNIEYTEDISEVDYIKREGFYIETPVETIVDCIHRSAFADAFAVLFMIRKRVKIKEFYERIYWKRIARSDIRVRQVLEYGRYRFYQLLKDPAFKTRKMTIKDKFIRRDIDEAVERVVEFV